MIQSWINDGSMMVQWWNINYVTCVSVNTEYRSQLFRVSFKELPHSHASMTVKSFYATRITSADVSFFILFATACKVDRFK